MKRSFFIWGMVLCVHIASVVQSAAAEESRVFSLYWENDVFSGTDRDYSNGLKLSWGKPYEVDRSSERSVTDRIIARLPWVNDPNDQRVTFFAVGQSVYTPQDTKRSDLIVDDRPYAGYTYASFGVHADTGTRRHVWELDLGVVGPWSRAQDVQDFVHDVIVTSRAAGWNHQLKNEVTLGVICENHWKLWRATLGDQFGIELIPHLGGELGNVATYANAGAELRFGWSLPKNFGTCPIRPGCDVGNLSRSDDDRADDGRFGVHLFVGVDGRAVLRNIFLDGNTFETSHSVDKEPFVTDLMSGIAFQFNTLQLSYAFVRRSREFKQQTSDQDFGAIKISYFY
jgi:lipid A 3-O-deacylase